MKQLKTYIRTSIGKYYRSMFTERNTVMWIEVPMSCNSVEHKNEIMISTLTHMEQIIKIK
jgi:hypothetical protein